MKGAFISGCGIAGFGILVSVLAGDWQTAFAVSAAAAGISMIISGSIRNFSLIQKRKPGADDKCDEEKRGIQEENKYWMNAFALFAFPNIVVVIILYFLLYK